MEQEIADLNIPQTIHETSATVVDSAQQLVHALNIPTRYDDLSLQGKVALWASAAIVVMQFIAVGTFKHRGASKTGTVVMFVSLIVAALFAVAYNTYSINCLVTGNCGYLAYFLSGLLLINCLALMYLVATSRKH